MKALISATAIAAALLALVAVPLVSILGYERHGHRHIDESLARLDAGRG